MNRRLKLLLFGEPGDGKSVFAFRFGCVVGKPFFFTTDGNYEWLDVWGAKAEDHVVINSWKEAKEEFGKDRPQYNTYVVDLAEDLFKWSEQEFCIENDIKHISHLPWSEGYDRQRNDFLNTMCKLINEDKHIIFIMHQTAVTSKDRRGIEKTFFRPSNRMPDKVLDVIEGRMNVLRTYLTTDFDENGNPVKKRMLSLVPKENEWAILRGVKEDTLPADIELEPEIFCQLLGLTNDSTEKKVEVKKPVEKPVQKEEPKKEVKVEQPKEEKKSSFLPKEEEVEMVEEKKEQVVEEPKQELKQEVKEEPKEVQQPAGQNMSEKAKNIEELRARIKAKLAGGNK